MGCVERRVVEIPREANMKNEVTEHYGRVKNGVIVLEEPEALPE